jgi:DNA polymerase-3 subunit epsilon
VSELPATIIAVDVETTGLHSSDRIVTLGAWRIRAAELALDSFETQYLHLIADPGRRSHPKAEEIHGYSDWTLRHQEPFSEHSDAIHDFLSSGDIVIAHNANFDVEFIDREYRLLGRRGPEVISYCTMNGYRESGANGRASLKAICEGIGLNRAGSRHGALEDAWLAMMVFFWLKHIPSRCIRPFPADSARDSVRPSNFKDPPPAPDGPLPRRSRVSGRQEPDTAVASPTLMKAVRPTAILLMEIASADGLVGTEEIDILTNLVRTTRDRLGLTVDNNAERELVAELLDIVPTQNLLTRAARAVYQDPIAREAFPKALANIARADGSFSDAERAAVDRIKAAITRVL